MYFTPEGDGNRALLQKSGRLRPSKVYKLLVQFIFLCSE